MTKNLGYILAAVIALLALGILWHAKTNEAAWSNEQRAYADSLSVVRSDFANAMAASAQLDSAINELTRQLDSAKHVRQPLTLVIHEAQTAFRDSSVDAMQRVHWSDPE